MFKTDKVYIDSQIEALKLRVEWLENELKYQAEQIRDMRQHKASLIPPPFGIGGYAGDKPMGYAS